ncbi:MAG: PorT family protein [Bacteroidetes bacterium]|nr:PorT family protein [Bacteroidota bacterium]
MHKNIFIILLVVFFSLVGIQVNGQGFKAGIVAGLSTSQISGDQLSGFNKAGILAGGFVSTQLSPKFDMQMEILYIQKGSRKNANPDKEDYTSYLLRLNYFEVPLLVQWKYSKRFILEAGPSIGVLLSTYEEDEYGEFNSSFPFEKLEFGVMGGLNVMLAKGFSFNTRFERSFIPVRDHVSGQTYRFNKGQYNSALLFSFRYKFEGRQKQIE